VLPHPAGELSLSTWTWPGAGFAPRGRADGSESLLGNWVRRLGQTIPLACQDWTNTKAAPRFVSNGRVNEAAILSRHLQSTEERFETAEGPVLVQYAVPNLTYALESAEAIGILHKSLTGKRKEGVCGTLMHSSLAIAVEGYHSG